MTCCRIERNTRCGSVSAGNSDGLQSRRAPEKKEPGRWALSLVLLVLTSRCPRCGRLQPGGNRSNASSQAQMDAGKRQVASGAGCYLGRGTRLHETACYLGAAGTTPASYWGSAPCSLSFSGCNAPDLDACKLKSMPTVGSTSRNCKTFTMFHAPLAPCKCHLTIVLVGYEKTKTFKTSEAWGARPEAQLRERYL